MSCSPPLRAASFRLFLVVPLIVAAAAAVLGGACRHEEPARSHPVVARADAAGTDGPLARSAGPGDAGAAVTAAAAKPKPRRALPANLPPGQQVALVHSANLRGEYEVHPLGGLGRRATYLAQLATQVSAVVQVDAGDSLLPKIVLGPGEPPPDPGEVERRARLLATGLGRLHLDGLVPGETDLQLGLRRYKDLVQKNHLPVLAANLVDAKGKRPFDAHRLIKVGDVTVGLFGVLTAGADDARTLAEAKLTLTDPVAAAQAAIALLREKGATIVIGLCHLGGGLGEARTLAAALSGLDVMVLGHDPQLIEDPIVIGDGAAAGTFIVAAGERGSFLGRLSLHLVDGDRGFADARAAAGPVVGSWADHEIVRLDPRYVSDPGFGPLIAAYIDENRRRATRKLPVGLTARAGTHGELADISTEDWTYATTAACALCHSTQKAQYDTTSHAFALGTLERKGRERDPYCLGCHSTGFDAPGGTRNLQTAIQYFGPTGCESCHGASVAHVRGQTKKGTQRKVAEAVCLRCHNNDHAPEPFDYVAALKEVLGPGHGQPPTPQ
jgi:2',3'-cyclic-nucleotide 2'-phosphodiesterase (5'-nucleotidase family)